MNILWAGGEDIDFQAIGNYSVYTTSGYFRSGWARCSIGSTGSGIAAHGNPFSAGPQTSAWLTARSYLAGSSSFGGVSIPMVGLGLYGTNNALVLGTSSSSASKIALQTIANGVVAQLAAEGGNSLAAESSMKFDMQVTNYGATATVNVYVNGTLVINFTGNVAVAGMTDFDHVYLGAGTLASGGQGQYSEFLVADSDTRALLGVQTLALNGAGTTTQWSNNTYTNINGISYSDANPTYVNTTAKDQEYTVTAPTPAVFSVIGVVQSARACIPSGSTPTALKLGYGSGGVGYFGTGASKSPTVGFADYQQIDQINPITSTTWVSADLAAPLQLDMQSS